MKDNLIPFDEAVELLKAVAAAPDSLVPFEGCEPGEWPGHAGFTVEHRGRLASLVLFFDANDDEPEYLDSLIFDGRFGDFDTWHAERGANPLDAAPGAAAAVGARVFSRSA